MKNCSIIIAAYNEAKNLENCLNSLCSVNFPPEKFEIIVIDNNSTDNTAEIVSKFSKVKYLEEKTQGAAFARNKGIKYSSGDILVFLDADTIVEKNWLKNIILPFNEKHIGAVGGAILPFKKDNLISEYLGVSLFMRYPRYGKKRSIKGFPSCNLALKKEALGQGFDTEHFTTYAEDKDLCLQIIDRGYKVIFSSDARITHKHPESLNELIKLLIKSSQGRFFFGKKYKNSPDIILFNYHIPLIYIFLLLLTFFSGTIGIFFVILLPSLLYLVLSSILFYNISRKFFLCFFIKPFLDILSVYLIYAFYTSAKLISFLKEK